MAFRLSFGDSGLCGWEGAEWGRHPGGGAGSGRAPEQMARSADSGWEPGTRGCSHAGGRGGVLVRGEAEQMGWGRVEFVLSVVTVEEFAAEECHDEVSESECCF